MAARIFDTVTSAFSKVQRWNKPAEEPVPTTAQVFQLHPNPPSPSNRQEHPTPVTPRLNTARPTVLPPVGLVPGQSLTDDRILRDALDKDWRNLGAQIALGGLGRDGLERELLGFRACFMVALRTMRHKRETAILSLKHQIDIEKTDSPHACKDWAIQISMMEAEISELDAQMAMAKPDDATGLQKGSWFNTAEISVRHGFKAATVSREQGAAFFE